MEGIEKAVPSVVVTQRLLQYIDEALKCQKIDSNIVELKQYTSAPLGSSIPFRIVRSIFTTLRDAGRDIYLHEMLLESDLHLPEPKLPPRDPELEARVQKLKIEAANKDYQRMVENVDVTARQEIKFQEDVKNLNRQIISVFNFLITVVGAFVFGYKGIEVAYGKIFPMQMMAGLLFGAVVFFADLYFLIKYSPQ